MDIAAIPHPPHRLPLLGDMLGVNPRKPIQSSLRLVRDLGPISVRKVLSIQIVMVGGADLTAELNDEARFAKFVGTAPAPVAADRRRCPVHR